VSSFRLDGGMATRVAHAPLATDSDNDTLTDWNTGGTERRPLTVNEVQYRE
jgi:hypothetical protein